MGRKRFSILVSLFSLTLVLTLSIDRTSVHASSESESDISNLYYIYLPIISEVCTFDQSHDSDNIGDAVRVCSGHTVSGQVSDDDWDDVYKIFAEASQVLTISMNGSGGDADLLLYPPGTTDVWKDPVAAYSDNLGNNEFIQYTVPVGGYWYIDVYSISGTTNYNVTATLTGP
jgi:hypothetical protein